MTSGAQPMQDSTMPPQFGATMAPDTLSPAEVLRMLECQFEALASQLGTLGSLDVVGRLGTVRAATYSTHYGVELRDSGGSREVLLIDIPADLRPGELAGKEVKVRGMLRARKGMKISLQVSRIRPIADVSPQTLAEEKSLREILRQGNAGLDVFPPALKGLKLTMICGISAQVSADFRNQVRVAGELLALEERQANFQIAQSIVEAIEGAAGAVVVLLRGGGNDGDFDVLNQPVVVECWRKKAAYKITAIGHSETTTLLDRFAHKVADTPTAAGKFVVDQVRLQNDVLKGQTAATTIAALQADAAKQASSFQQQLASNQSDAAKQVVQFESALGLVRTALAHLEAEKSSLLLQLEQAKAGPAGGYATPRWIWVAIVAAIIAGVVLGAMLARG